MLTDEELDLIRDEIALNTGRWIVETMEDGRMRVTDTSYHIGGCV